MSDPQVLRVLTVLTVLRACKGHKVLRVYRAYKETLARKGRPVLRVPMGPLVRRVTSVPLAHKALRELLVPELPGPQVLLAPPVVLLAQPEQPEQPEHKEYKERPELLVLMA
jgi:hypothetical protein